MTQEYAASVELGDHVKDPITGFEGTVISRTQFLHGCARCCVVAHAVDKEGKEITMHLDEAQVVIVEAGKHAPKPRNYKPPPGGPSRAGDPQDRPSGAMRR